MVRDEIVGTLTATFPEAVFEWRDGFELHVAPPIDVGAPMLEVPSSKSKQHAREIVLRFDRADIERLATLPPLQRAQSMDQLEKVVETALTGYDPGHPVPRGSSEPFVIQCDGFLIN